MLRYDLPASLVVFLIAVPLSLGIAAASGAPLVAGVIAAVVGGIVAGALGSSPLQVSGPAAGLTVIVAELVATYGWAATCAITVLAGALQLVLGALKVARSALAVSPAVIHGMLAGVGVVIVLAQLHVVLGGGPQSSAIANLLELPGQLLDIHSPAVLAGLLTIGVLVLWVRLPSPVRAVPAPLAAVVIATLVTMWAGRPLERVALPENLDIWHAPVLPGGDWHGIAAAVVMVAMVASMESLLCTVAVDRMHTGPRSDLDRELTAQGAGNMISGILGGLPIAGVIVRSTANARAGARSRWSTVLHAVWVLVAAGSLTAVINQIPMAALAALLVFTGARMVDLGHIRNLRGHREVRTYAVTLAGVVILGLGEGVLLGLALAAITALRRLTRIDVRSETRGHRTHVVVSGSLTFLGVPRLMAELEKAAPGSLVDLDLNVDFMDHAAFDALHTWRLAHEDTGGKVDIDEIHESWYFGLVDGDDGGGLRPSPRAKTPPPLPCRCRRCA